MESFGQREAVAGYEHDEEDCALVEGKNGEDADGALTVHGRDVLFERVRSFTTNGWLQSKIEAARARGREALSMLQDSLEEELDAACIGLDSMWRRCGVGLIPGRGWRCRRRTSPLSRKGRWNQKRLQRSSRK